jgi:squalene-hopene/tetraprenyl-beta-curcumene cyclase
MIARCLTASLVFVVSASSLFAAEVPSSTYNDIVGRGVAYLSQAQADDGSFSKQSGPAITALVATALLRHGRTVDDPVVSKALDYLDEFVQPDGGIHAVDSKYKNYETCLAIMCLTEANSDGRYTKTIENAKNFVTDIQWDKNEGHDESSLSYGGAGYGSHRRPDLSNTSFLVDALRAAGAGPEDEAMQRALVFVSRCQNLESEYNTTEFAPKVNDGGFYYTIAAGGSSQAGSEPDGGLRSYGSMTYAGLKSMIYAGVAADDPRVKAAYDWIRQHYTLEQNPGMGDAGLYYYYHTFAKALAALESQELIDSSGESHNWREDLVDQLAKTQLANGSWINSNARWLEADPNLVTGYALLALSYCRPQ